MIIDMVIPSLPPSHPGSPTGHRPTTSIPEEPERMEHTKGTMDDSERQAGLGHLMKSAKQDVSVPEFDMNAFF